LESICDERVEAMEMPPAVTWKDGRPMESMVGSGQLGTPRLRMHWANFLPSVSARCTTAGGQSPVSRHCTKEAANVVLLPGSRY
jgi:hypothetical protein